MALIVEDGTGLANAESFASVEFFKEYHEARGNTFTATDLVLEQCLRKATDYMEVRWSTKWVGIRSNEAQALSWPRLSAYYKDDGRTANGVPIEIQRACVEYALRAISGDLAPDPDTSAVQGSVIEREERVGPIMEKTVFASGTTISSFPAYPIVDRSMSALMHEPGYLQRV